MYVRLEEFSRLVEVPCFVEIPNPVEIPHMKKSISTEEFIKLHKKYSMVPLLFTHVKMKLQVSGMYRIHNQIIS